MICPFFSEREFFRGNDSGLYYAKQINEKDEMWWVGEHPTSNWVNVFQGSLSIGDDNECRWEGKFFDVPKGRVCNSGPLELGGVSLSSGASVLTRRTSDTPFGGSLWSPGFSREFADLGADQLCPGFEGEGLENLTGLWVGDDSGSYYIHDLRGTNEFVWFAEHPGAEPDEPGAPRGRQWANVFIGERDGSSVTGRWSDVPKGEIDQHGRLELEVEDEDTIRVTFQEGGYGGRVLVRQVSDPEVTVTFETLEIIDSQDRRGDEPYLEVAFAKMDGRTVDFTNLAVALVDLDVSKTSKLADNARSGTTIPLGGHIPPFVSTFVPVPGFTGDSPTVLGIAVHGWEMDRRDSESIRQGRLHNWKGNLESRLDRELQRSGRPNFHSIAGIRHFRFRNFDRDDRVGYDTEELTFEDLMDIASGEPLSLNFEFSGQGGSYQVTATVEVAACSRANPRCP